MWRERRAVAGRTKESLDPQTSRSRRSEAAGQIWLRCLFVELVVPRATSFRPHSYSSFLLHKLVVETFFVSMFITEIGLLLSKKYPI